MAPPSQPDPQAKADSCLATGSHVCGSRTTVEPSRTGDPSHPPALAFKAGPHDLLLAMDSPPQHLGSREVKGLMIHKIKVHFVWPATYLLCDLGPCLLICSVRSLHWLISGGLLASMTTVPPFAPKPDYSPWASRGDEAASIRTSTMSKKCGREG